MRRPWAVSEKTAASLIDGPDGGATVAGEGTTQSREVATDMPQILVVAGHYEGDALLRERVEPELLESDHYAGQLLERVRWALEDATDVEGRERAEGSRS
jgi:hypothetical protein